jgi:hypothetical protein
MLKLISGRTKRLLLAGIFAVAGGVMFQNCGSYQAGDSGINLKTQCDTDASLCKAAQLDESILLTLGAADISLLNADTSFDVGGYCDNGEYPAASSLLEYKIYAADNTTLLAYNPDPASDGWLPANYAGATSRCVDGRFTFSVPSVPPHASGAATLLIMSVRVVEFLPSGTEVSNGLNRNAQQANVYISAN